MTICNTLKKRIHSKLLGYANMISSDRVLIRWFETMGSSENKSPSSNLISLFSSLENYLNRRSGLNNLWCFHFLACEFIMKLFHRFIVIRVMNWKNLLTFRYYLILLASFFPQASKASSSYLLHFKSTFWMCVTYRTKPSSLKFKKQVNFNQL